jgi:hypothetical protein
MAESARIIGRFEVPVDDRWHTFTLSNSPLYVAARRPDVVEFWAVVDGAPKVERSFRVFGTGQPIPDDPDYWGTALAADGQLVWHLLEQSGG